MDTILSFLALIGKAGLRTLVELAAVFGFYLLFGVLLYLAERMTHVTYAKTIGWKGILWTAWLGTPVHETAHLVFCWIFRHRVNQVKFFSPDKESGTLGYVNHSYNPRSLYQSIGNLFIGLAPLFVGAAVIYLIFSYLVPGGAHHLSSYRVNVDPELMRSSPLLFLDGMKSALLTGVSTVFGMFKPEFYTNYRFWIFVYLAFCISSHLAPSPEDLKGAWSGLVVAIIVLWIYHIVCMFFGWNTPSIVSLADRYADIGFTLLTLSLIISIFHFVVAYLLLSTYSVMRGRGMISPF